MCLFADYVQFCTKVEGQGVTLTFDTHIASFTHLVKYITTNMAAMPINGKII